MSLYDMDSLVNKVSKHLKILSNSYKVIKFIKIPLKNIHKFRMLET